MAMPAATAPAFARSRAHQSLLLARGRDAIYWEIGGTGGPAGAAGGAEAVTAEGTDGAGAGGVGEIAAADDSGCATAGSGAATGAGVAAGAAATAGAGVTGGTGSGRNGVGSLPPASFAVPLFVSLAASTLAVSDLLSEAGLVALSGLSVSPLAA